jgi:hypothetical protein
MKPRKRGQFWEARWTMADSTEGTQPGFLTEEEAAIYGKQQRILEKQKRRDGIFEKKSKGLTFYEYLETSYAKGLATKDRTSADYEINLNKHLIPRFGKMPLSKITSEELETWRIELLNMRKKNGKKFAMSTLDKIEGHLATVLKKAVKHDYLLKNPFDKLDRGFFKRKIIKKRISVLEYEKVVAIANAMPAHLSLLIWLGFHTGMRPSELLGLTWDRIDFEKKAITIDRQIHYLNSEVFDDELKSSAAYREISLDELLEEKLLNHRAKFGLGPHNLLFHNRDGNVLRYKAALHAFVQASRPLGIPSGVGLHILRHTCVSDMAKAGIRIKVIQVWVGHKSYDETMNTYGHLFDDDNEIAASVRVEHIRTLAAKNKIRVMQLA